MKQRRNSRYSFADTSTDTSRQYNIFHITIFVCFFFVFLHKFLISILLIRSKIYPLRNLFSSTHSLVFCLRIIDSILIFIAMHHILSLFFFGIRSATACLLTKAKSSFLFHPVFFLFFVFVLGASLFVCFVGTS